MPPTSVFAEESRRPRLLTELFLLSMEFSLLLNSYERQYLWQRKAVNGKELRLQLKGK